MPSMLIVPSSFPTPVTFCTCSVPEPPSVKKNLKIYVLEMYKVGLLGYDDII
jgi:hypothetical protein